MYNHIAAPVILNEVIAFLTTLKHSRGEFEPPLIQLFKLTLSCMISMCFLSSFRQAMRRVCSIVHLLLSPTVLMDMLTMWRVCSRQVFCGGQQGHVHLGVWSRALGQPHLLLTGRPQGPGGGLLLREGKPGRKTAAAPSIVFL